jgi:ATP-binding cassette subfamily B protein
MDRAMDRAKARAKNQAGAGSALRLALGAGVDRDACVCLALAFLAAVLSAALTTAAPLLLTWLLDGFSRLAGQPELYALLAVYVFVLAAARLLDLGQAFLFATGDQRLQRRMAEASHAKVLGLPLRFHLETSPGGLVQILSQGQQGLRTWVMHLLFSLTPVLVQVPGILAVSAGVLTPGIAASLAAGAIVYGAVFYLGARRLGRAAREIATAQIVTSGRLADQLANIETIKSFGCEAAFGRDYQREQAAIETVWRGFHLSRLRNGVAISLVFAFTLGLSLVQGAAGVLDGRITPGGFVLLGAYVLQLMRPLELAGSALRDLGQASVYLDGWARLMSEPGETGGEAQIMRRTDTPCSVSFSDVSFAYTAGREALAGVSFLAPGGSLLAITGASGAGKTTIGRLLLKHFEPGAGHIAIGGDVLAELAARHVRARIAVVSQDTSLLDASLADNIRLGWPSASEAELMEAVRAAGLGAFLARLPDGLATMVGPRGLRISGGERQRVAIARALLRDSPVLLLDEPTSALDAETERALLDTLVDASRGRTTLLITHRTPLALRADQVIVLADGRIAEQGAPAALAGLDGHFARLCRMQAGAAASG